MWRFFMIGVFLVLAGCQQEQEPLPSGLAGFDPHQREVREAACVKSGGRFGKAGAAGTFVCFQTTRDANKQCRAASDCDAGCLARSRTCSPVTPLLGCQEMLTSSGTIVTECRE